MSVTLAHIWFVVAAVDLVFGLVTFRRAAAPDLAEDSRRSLRFTAGAMVLSAVALVLIALFLPIGRMRLF